MMFVCLSMLIYMRLPTVYVLNSNAVYVSPEMNVL